jgi:hypothetical protein
MNRQIALFILAASLATAADKDDPGGWTKAKWGMTGEDIVQAFAGDAARRDPPEKVSGIPIAVSVKSVDLAGAKFEALMVPDKDGKLKSVLLQPLKGEAQNAYLFQRLQDLLEQKYGRPWKSEADHDTSLQWTFPSTVITLNMTSMPAMNFCIVMLKYAYKTDAPI